MPNYGLGQTAIQGHSHIIFSLGGHEREFCLDITELFHLYHQVCMNLYSERGHFSFNY